jgi:hypothetical protein
MGTPRVHLLTGEYILTSGGVPTVDIFSYTMGGHPFVAKEWLGDVVAALAYRALGLGGVVLLFGSCVGGAFALVFRQARDRGVAGLLALGVTALALAASTVHWLARPPRLHDPGNRAHLRAGRQLVPRTDCVALAVGAGPRSIALGESARRLLHWAPDRRAYVAADALRWLGADEAESASARRRLRRLAPVLACAGWRRCSIPPGRR